MRTVLTSVFFVFLIHVNGQSIVERHPKFFEQIQTMDEKPYSDTTVLKNQSFLEHMTDGGGELIGYFDNTKLKKIKATIGLSHGIETNEFYYDSEGLVFIRVTFESFMYDTLLNSFDYEKPEVNFIGNYLYQKDKMIDLESLGHYTLEEQEDMEQYLLIQSKSFEKNIKTPANSK